MVNDANSFPVLSTMVKTKVNIKPNLSETTSYIKLGVIVDTIYTLILNIHLFVKILSACCLQVIMDIILNVFTSFYKLIFFCLSGFLRTQMNNKHLKIYLGLVLLLSSLRENVALIILMFYFW